jgi:hypothetical protein
LPAAIGAKLANLDFVRLGDAFGVNAVRVPPEGVGRAVPDALVARPGFRPR